MSELYRPYADVINNINRCYVSKTPFLFAINYSKTLGIFTTTSPFGLNAKIKAEINHDHNVKAFTLHSNLDEKLVFQKEFLSFQTYQSKFERVVDHLKLGNSYLLNLTLKTPIAINLSLEQIFHLSSSRYKLLVPGQFVLFSPERFVRIENGMISTNPMKGTTDADIDRDGSGLLMSKKENAEHNTVVDLLRNDLSIVAEGVRLRRLKYIEKIKTRFGSLWQMSSEIEGHLRKEFLQQPGFIFDKLLPAGSICGAPKKMTCQIIDDVEGYDRGFYTGVFGYFDGNSIDSAVMIRFIGIDPDGSQYYCAGGGITAQSILEDEYTEYKNKIYVPIF
ncbi:MAG: aminodeoxychorismate synthase component I [Saprospiraceae bacterium]|jgi:para-aminobenzoate synthetase component 1|nr:aminodeoxychorismate synthase component I [Saprospiraceae bacterium]MBK7797188.1 aminodeoxychorismate synthase component I [Saprospiraceae bacterium]MBK8152006.1 aminodeoxychorismate synthase component I [Saprospiraceae bacterium]MBK9377332.1 aminodeoxychorismate synthase component I [Saprospiraceae bacterium]MBL0261728.1 aminodeoxychorismate synthase component I [Saprospiraceae bacterium]